MAETMPRVELPSWLDRKAEAILAETGYDPRNDLAAAYEAGRHEAPTVNRAAQLRAAFALKRAGEAIAADQPTEARMATDLAARILDRLHSEIAAIANAKEAKA